MPSTVENLKTAFAGESQANRKYLAYAAKAAKEGYPQIARLFRAAAEAETIHALTHLQSLGGVGSTLDNLQDAIAGETYEYTQMYPPMVEQAEQEGHRGKNMLKWANAVEKVHAELYQQALAALQAGKDLELGAPPAKCPVCGLAGTRFQKQA
jgi:rubrerythrin